MPSSSPRTDRALLGQPRPRRIQASARVRRRVVVVLLLTVFAPIAVGCGGADGGSRSSSVALAIASAVEEAATAGRGSLVDLEEVVDAEWDTFFAFPPFADPEAVTRALGFPWPGAAGPDRGPRVRDPDGILLVFTLEEEVVVDIAFRRCRGDFGGDQAVTRGVPREEAKYVISYTTVGDDAVPCYVLTRLAPR